MRVKFSGTALRVAFRVSAARCIAGCLKLIASAPAELMGLAAGRLEKGGAADLVLFDAEEGWKVDADALPGKAQNSPFDGRPVQGRVLRTVIDGRTVFDSET